MPVSPEDEIINLQASILRIISNPRRLAIIYILKEKDLLMGELAKLLQLPLSNVSQHIALLRSAGLVITHKKSAGTVCSLSNPKISIACDMMRNVLIEQLQHAGELAKLS